MNILKQLQLPYKLKKVNRVSLVANRNETTAEHTFSTIALAEYFLKKHKKLNELKTLKLILYHDYCEIYAGDKFIFEKDENKENRENEAVKKLSKELPKEIGNELKKYWKEYLQNKTKEAKFAHAMDALDAVIHTIETPHDWKKYGFTESKLRTYKEPHLKEFPLLMKFFNEMVAELKKKKIIPED
jgi:putative hydrolase of HD superfamily